MAFDVKTKIFQLYNNKDNRCTQNKLSTIFCENLRECRVEILEKIFIQDRKIINLTFFSKQSAFLGLKNVMLASEKTFQCRNRTTDNYKRLRFFSRVFSKQIVNFLVTKSARRLCEPWGKIHIIRQEQQFYLATTSNPHKMIQCPMAATGGWVQYEP